MVESGLPGVFPQSTGLCGKGEAGELGCRRGEAGMSALQATRGGASSSPVGETLVENYSTTMSTGSPALSLGRWLQAGGNPASLLQTLTLSEPRCSVLYMTKYSQFYVEEYSKIVLMHVQSSSQWCVLVCCPAFQAEAVGDHCRCGRLHGVRPEPG